MFASDAASSEMLGVDAITISGKDLVVIRIAARVYKEAGAENKRPDGRLRMNLVTLCSVTRARH